MFICLSMSIQYNSVKMNRSRNTLAEFEEKGTERQTSQNIQTKLRAPRMLGYLGCGMQKK